MLKRFFSFISNRITGISTPFGGVSWKSSGKVIQTVARFDGHVYLTSKCNKDFLKFLDDNDRKIVFVNICIDASVSVQEQMEIAEKEVLNFQASCISGSIFTVPNEEDRLVSMVFYLKKDHILNHSHGGTGINTISLNGFFEISCSLYSGPSLVYYLKEIDAPFEEKIAMLNQ